MMTCFKDLLKWSWRKYKLSSCLLLTVVSVIYLIQATYFKSSNEDNEKESKNEIFETFKSINRRGFEGEILIHFDLKGAPPKLSYLLSLFPLIKRLGASGILLEYEDTFPYHSGLEGITALNAFNLSDIAAIVETARKENLSVIPLIPTLSHLGFVLKLEQYKELREVEEIPYVLCPSNAKGFSLLKKMVDQILDAHNTSKYLHIGCDEVDFLGLCRKCQEVQKQNKWRKDAIYFDHIRRLAEYINSTHPGVRPIVWSDKFLKKNGKITSQLADLVDVMFWYYNPKKENFPNKIHMNDFVKSFKNVWIAGAFKGATGKAQIVTNIDFHLKNTKGWLEFVDEWKTKINFKGIALTGWQRYNHFNPLCELLPVGIPSLAINIQYLIHYGWVSDKINDYLNCTESVPMELAEMTEWGRLSRLKCNFPGFQIYFKIHSYFARLKHIKSALWELRNSDFAFYNVNDLDPTIIPQLKKDIYKQHLRSLDELENEIKVALATVYDQYTITEWIATHVTPMRILLEASIITITKLSNVKVWPRRPVISKTLQAKKLFNSVCSSNETRGCTFFNIYI